MTKKLSLKKEELYSDRIWGDISTIRRLHPKIRPYYHFDEIAELTYMFKEEHVRHLLCTFISPSGFTPFTERYQRACEIQTILVDYIIQAHNELIKPIQYVGKPIKVPPRISIRELEDFAKLLSCGILIHETKEEDERFIAEHPDKLKERIAVLEQQLQEKKDKENPEKNFKCLINYENIVNYIVSRRTTDKREVLMDMLEAILPADKISEVMADITARMPENMPQGVQTLIQVGQGGMNVQNANKIER